MNARFNAQLSMWKKNESNQKYRYRNDTPICNFEGVILQNYRKLFIGRTFDKTPFDCRIMNANFTGARFINCTFSNCMIMNANFTGARFINCTFSNCKIMNANFINAISDENCTADIVHMHNCYGNLKEMRDMPWLGKIMQDI